MAGKVKHGKGGGRFIFEEKLALMQRLEAGETQGVIAAEAGVTRQYISLMWLRYQKDGAEGLRPGMRGRKKHRKPTPEEYELLRIALQNGTPASEGLADKPEQPWTLGLVRDYILRRWEIVTVRADIIPKLRQWGIRYATMEPRAPEDFGEDFVRYINSPIAKQIAEREKEYHRRWLEDIDNRKPKRGRPRKIPVAEEAGKSGAPEDPDEFDPNIDYVKLLAETQKAQAKAPGVRTGKHRKGSNRTKPKKKKRK